MWNVKFYRTKRGDYPVQKFLDEQDTHTKAKIGLSIRLLKNGGPFLKPPYMKKLQTHFYELRISASPPVRIFYTLHQGEYYLLHAFKKKTQKTSLREFSTALDRLKEII